MIRVSVVALVMVVSQSARAQEPSDLDLSADLRLREESNFRDPAGETFHRGRIRARFGVNYEAAEWLRFGTRLRTGNPDDPQSPYVDMTANFDSYQFALDRAFIRLSPRDTGLDLYGGKFAHVARSFEVLWDADVQPNGLGMVYDVRASDVVTSVRPSAFYYVLDNPNGGLTSDVVGGQILGTFRLGAPVTLTLASAVYAFRDIDSLAAESGNNTIDDPDPMVVGDESFVEEFLVSDSFFDLRIDTAAGEIQLLIDVGVNVAADDNELMVHARVGLGQLRDPSDWQVRYAFSDVQSDSLVAALAQDDFRLQTGYRGHEFHAAVKLADSVSLAARLYLFQQDVGSQRVQVRSRLDLDATF